MSSSTSTCPVFVSSQLLVEFISFVVHSIPLIIPCWQLDKHLHINIMRKETFLSHNCHDLILFWTLFEQKNPKQKLSSWKTQKYKLKCCNSTDSPNFPWSLVIRKLVPQFSPIVTGYVFGMVVGKKTPKKRVEMLQEMTLNSRARRSDFYQ